MKMLKRLMRSIIEGQERRARIVIGQMIRDGRITLPEGYRVNG